ncbi:uncharacterized protein [Miscanthus floridulus]|uniref:uncharacterized protein isoform X2 n=1 Tax=Miscanthus floridulus TaxID=154761 RepID=UPI00345ABF85
MAASGRNIACFALLVSILALQVPSCIDQRGTTSAVTTTTAAATASPSAPPSLLDDGALKAAMLALAGMDALFIAAAVIYSGHTHHAAVGAGGGGNWRISELAFFILCLQVGVLQFVLFVQQPAAAGDAAARALGISAGAAHALPCVGSVTFFLGITLVYAHVGNGGGAAGAAVAGNGPAPAPATVRLLADVTLGAALACLMSIILALFYFYVNTNNWYL